MANTLATVQSFCTDHCLEWAKCACIQKFLKFSRMKVQLIFPLKEIFASLQHGAERR